MKQVKHWSRYGLVPEFAEDTDDLVLICPTCKCYCLHAMNVSGLDSHGDLRIEFYCETCTTKLVLVIKQHKGFTQFWWDEDALQKRSKVHPGYDEEVERLQKVIQEVISDLRGKGRTADVARL